MLRNFMLTAMIIFCLTGLTIAGDLYRITLTGSSDALVVSGANAEPVLRLGNSYLVILDKADLEIISAAGIITEKIASDVTIDQLAFKKDHIDRPDKAQSVIFQLDDIVLYRIDEGIEQAKTVDLSLIPIRSEQMKIQYREATYFNSAFAIDEIELDSLVGLMDQDTITANLMTLQAFNGRVAGSSSNRSARDWLVSRLQGFGYGTVYTDPFTASTPYGWQTCYNVVAVKPGTVYPNRQIVFGAHFDAVEYSPGADDNGSGTTAVLEMARVLADIETEMTIVFILFDSEEQGLNGAWAYAGNAAASGDSIICMLNMDMIGNIDNDNFADIKSGEESGYAHLWISLSDQAANLTGTYGGQSTRSDHYAFDQNGYSVLYAGEYVFSSVYHTPQDSTTNINFNYLTRMAKATLATGYVINNSPLSVDISSVLDVGDGQSLQVNWTELNSDIDYYRVSYYAPPSGPENSVIVPGGQTSVIINSLDHGVQYDFSVVAVAADGDESILRDIESGIPYVLPQIPEGLSAQPVFGGVHLEWTAVNTELDFSHYFVVRDGYVQPEIITTNYFTDDDFSLGSDFHQYMVVAVDNQGNISDTVGITPLLSKAATLQRGKILAINRSSFLTPYVVDPSETAALLNDVCGAFEYSYIADTTQSSGAEKVGLYDLLDYELIVLGGESGRTDDFGFETELGGILEHLDTYMSMGGKVIMFGRWGDLKISTASYNTITFESGTSNYAYNSRFHMTSRTQYFSEFTSSLLSSDLVGVHSLTPEYPAITWDSLLTVQHSYPWSECTGIPCPTYATLRSGYSQILYTYDSRTNNGATENRPVAWKYLGPEYSYVFFEFPLSFMDRPTAETVLTTAIDELISEGPAGLTAISPDTVLTYSGAETISLYLGDFTDGMTAFDVDVGQIVVNETVAPDGAVVIASHPSFTGDVVEITVNRDAFTSSYGTIIDTILFGYKVEWQFTGNAETYSAYGNVVVMGETPEYSTGDANGDGTINVGDPVYLINHIFKSGPAPVPLEAGDANCDTAVNVGDAVFLINFIFNGGPPPQC